MIYTPPQLTPANRGSIAKQKAYMLAVKKNMSSPTEGAEHPVRYGTNNKQDKNRMALQLLGAGQPFPGGAPQAQQPPQGAAPANIQPPMQPPTGV